MRLGSIEENINLVRQEGAQEYLVVGIFKRSTCYYPGNWNRKIYSFPIGEVTFQIQCYDCATLDRYSEGNTPNWSLKHLLKYDTFEKPTS
jgi:hypothetical protein